ncbi:MAG: DUF2069 domain-containing protein [Burkholderiales bacterium]|nr:DUF2069 domain-containing protein [Burkholderiales bacterium]
MNWRRAVVAGLLALTLLSLAWELWLAPLRPGGSMLAWKALPLAVALVYAARGERRTFQWLSMLILFYFTEGVVRAWSEAGMSRILASIEIALSLWVYVGSIAASRAARPRAKPITTATDQDASR